MLDVLRRGVVLTGRVFQSIFAADFEGKYTFAWRSVLKASMRNPAWVTRREAVDFKMKIGLITVRICADYYMMLDVWLFCWIVPPRRERGWIVSVLYVSDKTWNWHQILYAYIEENFSSKATVVSSWIRLSGRSSINASLVLVSIVKVWWTRHSTMTSRLESCLHTVLGNVLSPRRKW